MLLVAWNSSDSLRRAWIWDQVEITLASALSTGRAWSRKIMSRQLENYGINNKKKKERQATSFKLDNDCRI
jgi:hypothetical protein